MGLFDIFKISKSDKISKAANIVPEYYSFDDEESRFVSTLFNALQNSGLNDGIRISTINKSTLNFCYDKIGQIGRVKIRGRKKRMQILSIDYDENGYELYCDVKWLEDISVDEMIDKIPLWIKHIQTCKSANR